MLIQHILRLRKFPKYAKSMCFLLVEIGSNWLEADKVANLLLNYRNAYEEQMEWGIDPVRNPKLYTSLCPGVLRSARRSQDDIGDLGPWMCMSVPVQNREHKDWVEYAPGYHCGERCLWEGVELLRELLQMNQLLLAKDDCSENPKASRDTLINQLTKFREDVKPMLDPVHGKPKSKPTGKAAGQQDDQVRNIQNTLFQVKKVLLARNHAFNNLLRQNSWRVG
jgi:hypothetical protein